MLINSALDLIGNTPMVKLNSINTYGNNIYLKLEGFNPSRSTKDRIVLAMIEKAEQDKKLDEDTVVIESTSGNTGISLAMVCAIKGYKLKIVMPDNMSKERMQLMRAYGAEVVLTDGKLGMKGCVEKMEELKKSIPKHFVPDQFTNEMNPRAHYENTAEEIIKDLNGKVDYFICGTGTGGSFSGTSKKLREKIPGVKTMPVEPEDSPLLSKGYTGPHKIQGMGMSLGKVPDVYNKDVVTDILTANYDKSIDYVRLLATKEGVLVGISTGAVLSAAIEVAKENENKNLNIVVLSTDSGEKYLSNNIF